MRMQAWRLSIRVDDAVVQRYKTDMIPTFRLHVAALGIPADERLTGKTNAADLRCDAPFRQEYRRR